MVPDCGRNGWKTRLEAEIVSAQRWSQNTPSKPFNGAKETARCKWQVATQRKIALAGVAMNFRYIVALIAMAAMHTRMPSTPKPMKADCLPSFFSVAFLPNPRGSMPGASWEVEVPE